MKKRIIIPALCVCILAVFACAFIPASANNGTKENGVVSGNVLEARFLNMLNRNYVYNSDFEDAGVVVEDSVLALLNCRDSEDPRYISDTVVKGFVNDMYGIEIVDIAQDESVYKEGFVYIVPRGYTAYSHTVTDITENEDGSYTVISAVTVSPHDDEDFVTEAKTLFVPNEKSAFGYRIIYSVLKGTQTSI